MSGKQNDLLPCMGITIEGHIIRSVEIDQAGDSAKLLAVNEVEASGERWTDLRYDQQTVDNILSYLDPMINGLPEQPGSIAFAVNRSSAIIKVHLVDSGLPEDEKEEFVLWEANKRFGDYSDDYYVDLYPLSTEVPKFSKYLSVALKKDTIELFESLSSSLKVPLEILDVDLLAGINSILFLYEAASSGNTAVLRYLDGECALTLLNNGEFSGSVLFQSDGSGDTFTLDRSDMEGGIEELMASLFSGSITLPLKDVDRLYFYSGNEKDKFLQPLIEKADDEQIIQVDPFATLEISDDVANTLLKNNPARFTETLGMAVRTLNTV